MALVLHQDSEAYLLQWAVKVLDHHAWQYITHPDASKGKLSKHVKHFFQGFFKRTGCLLTIDLLEIILLNATHEETAPQLHMKSVHLFLGLKRVLQKRYHPSALRQFLSAYLLWKEAIVPYLFLNE